MRDFFHTAIIAPRLDFAWQRYYSSYYLKQMHTQGVDDMKRRVALLFVGYVLFGMIQGCSTLGISSLAPSREVTVYMGKTTEAEVVEQIGNPRHRIEMQISGKPITELQYRSPGTPNVMLTVCDENGQCRTNAFGKDFNSMGFRFQRERGGVMIYAFP